MAASTITRESMTDNVTVWNVTRIGSAIYDRIDTMFAGAVTFGGLVNSEGFGTHTYSSGGTGANEISIRNTSAGTGNLAGYKIGNNSTANLGVLWGFSSTYTSAGLYNASGVTIEGTGSGGLTVAASDASGYIRFHTGGSTERLQITPQGHTTVKSGAITSGSALTAYTATHLVIGAGGTSPQSGMIAWGDGTGYNLDFGTRSGGNFTVRTRMTDAGQVLLSDGSASTPSLSLMSDTNTGLYRYAGDEIGFAAGGVDAGSIQRGSQTSWRINGTANSTGTNVGNYLLVGRNTSGNGAAGSVGLTRRGGTINYIWADDSGNLMIHTAQPTEDNTTVSHNAGGSGTVVGTQTSLRATKRAISDFLDHSGALDLIKRTPLYRFQYREFDPETRHVGIMADESPEFVRFGGTTFDPINAFGYTAAAIKALIGRVESLEAALSGRPSGVSR